MILKIKRKQKNILFKYYHASTLVTSPFDWNKEKLQRLGEAESGQLTKEEFNKMKQELEAEYLATFKVH